MTKGIDLSYANDIIDYDKLASEIDFAIIRAGYGNIASQKDKKFEQHYAELVSRGVPVGAYWYSYADTPSDAEMEGKACLEVLGNKKFEYPVFFDVEEPKQATLSPEIVTLIVNKFCAVLEQANFWAGVYSCKSLITTKFKTPNRYALWCASIDSLPHKDSTVYQYSWSGKGKNFGQSTGDIDLDICTIDYPRLIRQNHKNNY